MARSEPKRSFGVFHVMCLERYFWWSLLSTETSRLHQPGWKWVVALTSLLLFCFSASAWGQHQFCIEKGERGQDRRKKEEHPREITSLCLLFCSPYCYKSLIVLNKGSCRLVTDSRTSHYLRGALPCFETGLITVGVQPLQWEFLHLLQHTNT